MATGFSVMDALSKNSKQGVEETPRARFRTKDISIHKIYSNSKNFYYYFAICSNIEKFRHVLEICRLNRHISKYVILTKHFIQF